MQVQNPQYRFYKMLAGIWKSSDTSCTVTLDEYANLEITFKNARLNSSYSVIETNSLYGAGSMSMMGFMGQAYEPHFGEELRIQMNNTSLSDGTINLFTVKCMWYGGQNITIELINISDGQTTALILTREGEKMASGQTGYVCECGYSGPIGKFCPNCGKAVEVEKEYTCECGYRSKSANFCPNCGRPIGCSVMPEPEPEPKADPEPEPDVPLKPEDELISISTFITTNPPVNTYATVYRFSDTQLLLDCNGKRRMISADVLKPAMEIIRRYRLDDPDFKDPSAMGIMGGSVTVGFKDGDRFVNTSLQTQGFAVLNAENELRGLFNSYKGC